MDTNASATEVKSDWVQTIEEGKGYAALPVPAFERLLLRMPTYAFFRAVERHCKPGSFALEAGCGWALTSFALAARGVRVTAIDISSQLIEGLQTLQKEIPGEAYRKNLTLQTGDIFRLHETGQRVSVVFSDGTYQHFLERSDREDFLRNISAILEPGGKFIVAVPNLQNPFFSAVVDERMPAMQPFTVFSLAAELEQAGFRICEKGYSFVNPGFEQWVQSRWMIGIIRIANAVFPYLPRPVKGIFAAHLYCVAERSS